MNENKVVTLISMPDHGTFETKIVLSMTQIFVVFH